MQDPSFKAKFEKEYQELVTIDTIPDRLGKWEPVDDRPKKDKLYQKRLKQNPELKKNIKKIGEAAMHTATFTSKVQSAISRQWHLLFMIDDKSWNSWDISEIKANNGNYSFTLKSVAKDQRLATDDYLKKYLVAGVNMNLVQEQDTSEEDSDALISVLEQDLDASEIADILLADEPEVKEAEVPDDEDGESDTIDDVQSMLTKMLPKTKNLKLDPDKEKELKSTLSKAMSMIGESEKEELKPIKLTQDSLKKLAVDMGFNVQETDEGTFLVTKEDEPEAGKKLVEGKIAKKYDFLRLEDEEEEIIEFLEKWVKQWDELEDDPNVDKKQEKLFDQYTKFSKKYKIPHNSEYMPEKLLSDLKRGISGLRFGIQDAQKGDYVSFKSDVEQSGKVVKISGSKIVVSNPNGFQGDYIGGETQATINKRDAWIESMNKKEVDAYVHKMAYEMGQQMAQNGKYSCDDLLKKSGFKDFSTKSKSYFKKGYESVRPKSKEIASIEEAVDYPQFQFAVMVPRDDYQFAAKILNDSNVIPKTQFHQGGMAVIGFDNHQETGDGKPNVTEDEIIKILNDAGIAAISAKGLEFNEEPMTIEIEESNRTPREIGIDALYKAGVFNWKSVADIEKNLGNKISPKLAKMIKNKEITPKDIEARKNRK